MRAEWYLGQSLPLLEQTAKFAERRQEVLAGNIANIDTPGYRTRDLSVENFQAAMQKAVAAQRQASSGHQPGESLGVQLEVPQSLGSTPAERNWFDRALFQSIEPADGLTFHDANNRSVEQQFLNISKNSMLQGFAVELMTLQFNQLQMAISGRP